MKKIRVKVMYNDFNEYNDMAEDLMNFEIVLTKTGWFSFMGEWNCLPGYMKQTKGYFSQDTTLVGSVLFICDREATLSETMFGNATWNMYMALDGFTDSPRIGMNGKGSVYSLGAKGEKMFANAWGRVHSFIKWKITEVN